MSDIPDTNTVIVAKIAAALRLAQARRHGGDNDTLKEVLDRFVVAYEVVDDVVEKEFAEARKVVEEKAK